MADHAGMSTCHHELQVTSPGKCVKWICVKWISIYLSCHHFEFTHDHRQHAIRQKNKSVNNYEAFVRQTKTNKVWERDMAGRMVPDGNTTINQKQRERNPRRNPTNAIANPSYQPNLYTGDNILRK